MTNGTLSVREMLAAPSLRELVALTHPRKPRMVNSVWLVEETRELAGITEGAFVIATRAALSQPTGYLLDTAVRRAGGRRAAALAFRVAATGIPATASGIADRAGLTLVGISPDADLGGICATIGRELDAGAAAALGRVSQFVDLVDSAGDRSPDALAVLAGQALGVRVRMADPTAATAGPREARVVVDGRPQAVITAAGGDDRAAALVLRLASELAGRSIERERRRSEAPIRSAGLLMAELLTAPAQRAMALADRARALEIPVDGWHVAIRLAPIDAGALIRDDDLAALELYDELAAAGLHAARLHGGVWHLARLDEELILVRMSRTRPSEQAASADVTAARAIIAAA
ncbi:MAG TPA: hypothetical protein VMU66_01455, partial [Gaiellales bacterium]|nr:hypothetical protein [Gaiellales bacterium]